MARVRFVQNPGNMVDLQVAGFSLIFVPGTNRGFKIFFIAEKTSDVSVYSTGICHDGPWQVHEEHYTRNIIGSKSTEIQVGGKRQLTMFVRLSGKMMIIMTHSTNGSFLVTDRNGLHRTALFNIKPGHYYVYARGLGKTGRQNKHLP